MGNVNPSAINPPLSHRLAGFRGVQAKYEPIDQNEDRVEMRRSPSSPRNSFAGSPELPHMGAHTDDGAGEGDGRSEIYTGNSPISSHVRSGSPSSFGPRPALARVEILASEPTDADPIVKKETDDSSVPAPVAPPEDRLHVAVWLADLGKIEQLVAEGVDVNEKDFRGITPLYLAIQLVQRSDAYRPIVSMLLKHKANPQLKTPSGWTAIDEAVSSGDRQCVREVFTAMQHGKRQKWRRDLPGLVQAMSILPDFYLEIRGELESSVIPFVNKVAPSDTFRMWKKGTSLRLDSTFVSWKPLRGTKRRPITTLVKLGQAAREPPQQGNEGDTSASESPPTGKQREIKPPRRTQAPSNVSGGDCSNASTTTSPSAPHSERRPGFAAKSRDSTASRQSRGSHDDPKGKGDVDGDGGGGGLDPSIQIYMLNRNKATYVVPDEEADDEELDVMVQDLMKADPIQGDVRLEDLQVADSMSLFGAKLQPKVGPWNTKRIDLKGTIVLKVRKKGFRRNRLSFEEYFGFPLPPRACPPEVADRLRLQTIPPLSLGPKAPPKKRKPFDGIKGDYSFRIIRYGETANEVSAIGDRYWEDMASDSDDDYDEEQPITIDPNTAFDTFDRPKEVVDGCPPSPPDSDRSDRSDPSDMPTFRGPSDTSYNYKEDIRLQSQAHRLSLPDLPPLPPSHQHTSPTNSQSQSHPAGFAGSDATFPLPNGMGVGVASPSSLTRGALPSMSLGSLTGEEEIGGGAGRSEEKDSRSEMERNEESGPENEGYRPQDYNVRTANVVVVSDKAAVDSREKTPRGPPPSDASPHQTAVSEPAITPAVSVVQINGVLSDASTTGRSWATQLPERPAFHPRQTKAVNKMPGDCGPVPIVVLTKKKKQRPMPGSRMHECITPLVTPRMDPLMTPPAPAPPDIRRKAKAGPHPHPRSASNPHPHPKSLPFRRYNSYESPRRDKDEAGSGGFPSPDFRPAINAATAESDEDGGHGLPASILRTIAENPGLDGEVFGAPPSARRGQQQDHSPGLFSLMSCKLQSSSDDIRSCKLVSDSIPSCGVIDGRSGVPSHQASPQVLAASSDPLPYCAVPEGRPPIAPMGLPALAYGSPGTSPLYRRKERDPRLALHRRMHEEYASQNMPGVPYSSLLAPLPPPASGAMATTFKFPPSSLPPQLGELPPLSWAHPQLAPPPPVINAYPPHTPTIARDESGASRPPGVAGPPSVSDAASPTSKDAVWESRDKTRLSSAVAAPAAASGGGGGPGSAKSGGFLTALLSGQAPKKKDKKAKEEAPEAVRAERPDMKGTLPRKSSAMICLTDEFPLTLEAFMPVLDIFALQHKTIAQVRDFLQSDELKKYMPPDMFPVRLQIPLNMAIRASLTFQNFELRTDDNPIPDEEFEIPEGYTRLSRKEGAKTTKRKKKRALYTNLYI